LSTNKANAFADELLAHASIDNFVPSARDRLATRLLRQRLAAHKHEVRTAALAKGQTMRLPASSQGLGTRAPDRGPTGT
jgi:hypothetical protein